MHLEHSGHAILDAVLRTSLDPRQALVCAQSLLRPLATVLESLKLAHDYPTINVLSLEAKASLVFKKLYIECLPMLTVKPALGNRQLTRQL